MSAPVGRKYVLITAAHNEEAYVERTLQSVVAQVQKPLKWVVVNDRSTDRTGPIVEAYAKQYEFIELVEARGEQGRGFSSKVHALSLGYQRLQGLDYDFLGILDGDISFDPQYYSELLAKFSLDPKLGLCGGFIYEEERGEFQSRKPNTPLSVAGATQVFRRECYEAIGGLRPIPYGGEDWCAEVGVRMRGWKVQAFPELKAFHHRATGTGGSLLRYLYRQGKMDYALGSLPSFEIVKCARRVMENPFVLNAAARWTGFCVSSLRRAPRLVSKEFIDYLREEQRQRLRAMIRAGSKAPEFNSSVDKPVQKTLGSAPSHDCVAGDTGKPSP
ncbi:MAG: glycosyltransferase family 2 protein [Terriglobales bacterium]|jgi:glycosyltransferase involved in cell wall biosynthesis